MTSILKNQILKHLTKFTKNLSPEKIKINAFKGEGDVSNLELDEIKLTELLELPNWLKIKGAACNKVLIKVQWTMIKKLPIILVLDEVLLVVEALQIPRPAKSASDIPSYRTNTGSYGFIDRVLDGIKVKINTVRIIFTSATFKANIELMRVVVSSKMPNWAEADHLKKTRVKSNSQGSVLLFKEVEWDSTRVEASSLQNSQAATPVKLITNTTKVRVIIKKNLADCSILESKVELILNDLFWVLTISQIKAAILFSESLMGLIQLSNERNKEAMKLKLENSTANNKTSQSEAMSNSRISANDINTTTTQPNHGPLNNRQRLFMKHDLKETSYHLLIARVEFHFCEEGEQGISMTKNSVINGSIKLLICNTQIDLYPYHIPGLTRDHFPSYKEMGRARNKWISECFQLTPSSGSESSPLSSTNQIMESVTLVRFNEITINCVCSSVNSTNIAFIGSDIERHKLPKKTNTFTMDFTEHYCKKSTSTTDASKFYTMPNNTVFVQINPFFINLDWTTVIWLNAFYLNLSKELERLNNKATELISELGCNIMGVQPAKRSSSVQSQRSRSRNSSSSSSGGGRRNSDSRKKKVSAPIAIHLEAIMPRIVFTPNKPVTNQPDRPKTLQLLIGTLTVDNMLSSKSDIIQTTLKQFHQSTNFFQYNSSFPFTNHDVKPNLTSIYQLFNSTNRKSNTEKLWKISLDPLWLEFDGAANYGDRNRPFLEPIHIILLVSVPSKVVRSTSDFTRSNSTTTNNEISIICGVSSRDKVDIRIDHYQLMLIYRVMDDHSLWGFKLAEDLQCFYGSCNVKKPTSATTVSFLMQIDEARLSLQWLQATPENDVARKMSLVRDNLLAREHTSDSNQVATYEDKLSNTITNITDNTVNDVNCMTEYNNVLSLPPGIGLDCVDSAVDTNLFTMRSQNPYSNSSETNQKTSHNPLVGSKTGSPVLNDHKLGVVNGSMLQAGLQSNRRSYTSLSTIGNDPIATANLNSSNLLTFKSVRNLLSSTSGGGRMSRKGSQTSLASSVESSGFMGDKNSMDSDNSDWISEGLLDLGEVEMAEDMLMMDNLVVNALQGGGVGDCFVDSSCNGRNKKLNSGFINFSDSIITDSDEQDPVMLSIDFTLQDLRLLINSGETTAIVFGVFGNILLDESGREDSASICITNPTSTTTSEMNNNGSGSGITYEDNKDAVILGRIDIPNENVPMDIEIRIIQSLRLPLLMSTLTALADLFEDEVAMTMKYGPGSPLNAVPSRIQLVLSEGLVLLLTEDRICSVVTCSGEHASTELLLPPGLCCIVEGTTKVSLFQTSVQTHQPQQYIGQPSLCQRCNKKFNITNHSTTTPRSSSPSPGLPTAANESTQLTGMPFERSNFRVDKKIKDLQNQNRLVNEEVEILRLELARITKERDAMRNLIQSPSTNLI